MHGNARGVLDREHDEGVTLSVAESGFSRLGCTAEERRELFDEHNEGWMIELAAARAHPTGDR